MKDAFMGAASMIILILAIWFSIPPLAHYFNQWNQYWSVK